MMVLALSLASLCAQEAAPGCAFLEKHCLECHDAENRKGDLDLRALGFKLHDPATFARWVKVHDRVRDGEMPPKKRERPEAGEVREFLASLSKPMVAADEARAAREGRSTWRRLNRFEYENSIRELLQAPWLEVKEILPEDGEAHRFNKVGDALDISHIQMAQYLEAAGVALRDVVAKSAARPESGTTRYYAREMPYFAKRMKFNEFNRAPERATFPVLGFEGQPDVRSGKAPISAPETREQEAMAVVASSYEPLEPRFDYFKAAQTGRYRVRLNAYAIWVGPGPAGRWYRPDLDVVSRGRRPEPVSIYALRPPQQIRHLGTFDAAPDPTVMEMEVWLIERETIRVDAARLFRSRPPDWKNPLAEKDGQPGVAFRWLEVEGPLSDAWPPAGHRLLFGNPPADAESLLRGFLAKAYRRPVAEADVARFLKIIRGALQTGSSFAEAMIAGYSTVLCSPGFICLEERPGTLDDHALAARLSYFLWNSPPDEALRALAARGELSRPGTLGGQIERLLDDPRSARFIDSFLDYWLDLRFINATSPDAALYPDYYLDDLLVESAVAETRRFFTELLAGNLPARHVADSDFIFVNERLAAHYGLPAVDGVKLRRVKVPPGSPRGGLMTQASVLKVSANGTTTSPVLRGAWIMERILGEPPPPPPPSVPAIEPDTRGAVTIREQLEKHRTIPSCAACHAKIDPPGHALENFDVLGGWRDRYRALGGEGERVTGQGKNGQAYKFLNAQRVDASGALPDGRPFKDIFELKRLLLQDERKIARNVARQLMVYATGAPIRFGDRGVIETILERTAGSGFGVRSIVREIIQSDLFKRK